MDIVLHALNMLCKLIGAHPFFLFSSVCFNSTYNNTTTRIFETSLVCTETFHYSSCRNMFYRFKHSTVVFASSMGKTAIISLARVTRELKWSLRKAQTFKNYQAMLTLSGARQKVLLTMCSVSDCIMLVHAFFLHSTSGNTAVTCLKMYYLTAYLLFS